MFAMKILIDGIENTVAALIGLKTKRYDMEQLDSFEDEMKDDITELNETRDVRELLKEQVEEIDQKLDEILDNLNDLEGEAAESVKQELLDKKEKKMSEIEEKERFAESKEQELNEKMQNLDNAINERRDALNKVQELGSTADIDVGDAVGDINDEINRLEEDKQSILEALKDNKR